MLNEDVKNPISLYIVVRFIMRIIEDKLLAIFLLKLKTIINPGAREIEEISKDGCFI